jgi:hypothetical protein
VGVGVAVNATIPDKFQVLGDIRTGTATTNGCIKNFAGTGIVGTCSSDERLKTNIVDITGALDKIKSLRPVTYQWNSLAHDLYNNNADVTNRGFLAQNIESIYPELVITDSNGYKQVDYSGMSIYTAAAVKELAIKLDSIEKVSTETLLQGSLRQWFADATNGITDFFAGRVRTNELCIGSTCLNESQIQQILQSTSVAPVVPGETSQSSSTTTTEQAVLETTTNQVTDIPVSNDLGNNIDTPNGDTVIPSESAVPSENPVQ